MPEQIENLMLNDDWWKGVEELQMRFPDNNARRLQQIIDEMEYGRMEKKNERENYGTFIKY